MAAAKLEDLAVGGLLPTGFGGIRPIQLIARHSVDRTLFGLFIDDVLVSAGSLINEMTITLYAARELNELEFFHIKLDSHDGIHAEE